MDDFSLVPMEHQPDFEDASLVPVDHDPFGADGVTQQAQQTQTQPQEPQQTQSSITGENLPDIGAPLIGDGGQLFPGTAFGQKAADVASKVAYGMMKQVATLPQRAIDAARVSFEHNYGPGPSTLSDSDAWVAPLPAVAAETALTMMGASSPVPVPAGTILGANKVIRGVAADDHHPFPIYLGGPVKQELVRLPRSLHQEFHKGLDEHLSRWEGKAYYDSLAPTERQEALQTLATYTKDFDAKHGTKL